MVTNKKIIQIFGGNVCRKCINKKYRIHLVHTDCKYELPYPALCPNCKEMKNIVTGFRFSAYIKSMFKKKGRYS